VQGTDIKEELDNRLQEIIDSHLSSLGAEFRRLIGDLPLQVDTAEEASGESQAEALAHLKQSVEAIHATSSQREMAYRLLDAASQQAARSALFLMRGATCVGFETRGFADPPAEFDQTILTPVGDDPLCAALNQQETMHLHGSSLAASALADWIGEAQPQQVCLAPVVVGGQTVAVVYADSGVDAEAGTIYPESVEILASVAGMFLERMRRPAPALTDRNQAAGETTDHPVENPTSGEDYQAVPLSDESDAAETTLVADPSLAPAQDAPDSVPQDTEDDLAATRILVGNETPPPSFDPTATVALSDLDENEAIPVAVDMEAGPLEATPSVADAGEESQQEGDARRFARLLVSEIVLYNEAQVKAGQKNADLLNRLKEPITRSRQTYEERFGAQTLDFFNEELVRTLADGDPRLLGLSNS
jgi:hypothetical protein